MPFATTKLWMGQGTYEIPLQLYSLNRNRLVERLKLIVADDIAVVVLQGGSEVPLYDTDINYTFRQEPYFNWAFGVAECDCYGAIDVNTGNAYLFIPSYPERYAFWMGPLHPPDDFKQKYGIQNVYYISEIANVLKSINPSVLLTLTGINSDSGLCHAKTHFDGIEQFNIDEKILYPEIAELRSIKTHYELEVIRYVVGVSSAAHRKLMKSVKPGKFEYQCESEFMNEVYKEGGCQHLAYDCITCSGLNGAVLHYGFAGTKKDRMLQDGDMCLFDMGASYFGYASDITCSFPVNGRFTNDQRMIYQAVLKANLAVAKEAKPGTSWACMHILANRVVLSALKDGGLLKGEIPDMINAGLAKVFQPHGLGHLLGLDVHDVGGYLPEHPARGSYPPGIESLRTARNLKEGMVLTIEPGCYFVDNLLDKAIADPSLSKFLILDAIKRFRGFGGVRIEDDVVITAAGVKNIVDVPRTIEEIEAWMAKDN